MPWNLTNLSIDKRGNDLSASLTLQWVDPTTNTVIVEETFSAKINANRSTAKQDLINLLTSKGLKVKAELNEKLQIKNNNADLLDLLKTKLGV